jgi:amino acid adenylation domain-containing protein
MVLLKRLDDALADGDTVHAVIRATAVNNDGARKVGYTAPGVEGQARVVADALAAAGVDPSTLQYVETHGTGTPLGDAIELRAMARALGPAGGAPCAIGSVKGSVGHLDAAAGVAGLVKTVLALEHGEIPPSLHCAVPHPEIAASGGRVAVNTALRPWPRAGGAPRRAGVSSFGIGGTNAHAVLEEAPPREPSGPSRALQLLVVSARTASARAAAAESLAARLEGGAPPLADAAYTLQCGRRQLEHRLAVVCADAQEGARALRGAAARASSAAPRADRPAAFLFPGLGTHHVDMGRGLYDAEPAYRQAVDECCALLHPLLGSDLREALFSAAPAEPGEAAAEGGWDLRRLLGRGGDAGPSALDDTRLAQPALFVTEYALAKLWMGWGVMPRALLGHSLGEYVAACVAGVMRLDDALRLVALRARLIAGLPAGAMLAVPLGEAALRAILPPALDVAAVNTPESCVVAGPAGEIGAFEAALAARGTVSRRLATRHAFHSRAMRPAAAELERLLAGVSLAAPRIPFVSNVTGTWIGDLEARSPAYWARHLCGTVRFADGVATLREEPGWVLVEMGPGQTLGAWAMQHPARGAGHAVLSALRHRDNRVGDPRFALEALGSAWCAGVEVDWAAFSRGERRHRVPLPGYPFERRRYWVDPPPSVAAAGARAGEETSAAAAEHTSESDQRGRDPMDQPTAAHAATSPRRRAVLERLRGLAAELTGIEHDEVRTDVSFFQAGFDSLLLLQAVQAVEARFGARVSLVQLLEEIVTLDALAAHLDAVLPPDVLRPEPEPGSESAPHAAPPAPAAAPPAPVSAHPAQARAVAEPTAFYPAPPDPAVSPVPGVPANGAGAGPLERLMAQQLQVMAQQNAMGFQLMAQQSAGLQLMAQQIAALSGAQAPPSVAGVPAFLAGEPAGATPASAAAAPSAAPGTAAAPVWAGACAVPAASPDTAASSGFAGAPAGGGAAGASAGPVPFGPPEPGTTNGNGRAAENGAKRAVPQSPRARIQPEAFVAYQPLNTEGPGAMTAQQRAYLDGFVARYVERTRASRAHQERYHLPLADSRVTARFRRAWKGMLYPIVGVRAQGSRVWDLDGNEYVDTGMAFGCNLFGHGPDFVSAAIREQVERGYGVGPQSPHAGRAAELVCRVGGNERAVFCNSGTEAVMGAIRAARTFTGRTRVAYFTGSYHGWSDIVQGRPFTARGRAEVRPTAPGISSLPLQDVLMLDYDQPESLELLARHLHEIAVVMVEPVQSRRLDIQPRAFLHELRRMTRDAGAVLLFDELITGFRIGPGGAQEFFGVDADLVTYGKIVAGGLPMGVVAGKREVMSVFDGGLWRYDDDSYPTAQRTLFAGAFFKHPLSMAVACSILEEVERRGAPLYEALNARAAALVQRLNAFFEAERFPITTVHFGSCFRFFFGPEVAYPDLFSHHLIHEGVHVLPETGTHFLSTAHTDEDLDFFFRAVCSAAGALRGGGFIPRPPAAPASPSGNGRAPASIASAGSPSGIETKAGTEIGVGIETRIGAGIETRIGTNGVRALPLTEGQRQLWAESQMGDEAGLAYIESTSIRLRGRLDADALRAALRGVVARHDTLRTTFAEDGEAQHVHPAVPVEVPFADLRGADVDEWLRRTVRRPFDLARGPLFRFDLGAVGEDEHLLVVSVHHAALDGWSFGVVLGELGALYEAAKAGRAAELPPRPDHGALVRAQVDAVRGDAAAEAWWRERFADGVPVLELPTDRPRPPVRSYRGDRVERVLGDGVLRRLAEAGRPHGLTVFHTVFAAFYAWLGRLAGQDDLVAGTPAAGQAATPGAAALVGYAINVLPVRVRLDPAAPFVEHARGVRRALMHAVEHQNVSFPRLVEALVKPRDPGRPPLFAVMLDLDRAAADARIGDLRATFESNFGGGSKLDLNLELTETAGALRVACDYATDLFDRETVEAWLDGFARLLEQVAEAPATPLERLSLAGPAERARVVEEWNRTEHPVPGDACVHHLFAARAAAAPDAVALEWGDERLSYAELDARANRLARHLRRRGVGVEDPVGVLLERGAEAVVATLAVLRAGGCCVPVDTSYPPERMALMLEDAGARILLTRGALAAGVDAAAVEILRLDDAEADVAAESGDGVDGGATAANLAYLFYTSGSTGRPKGVMMGHREVARFALALPACMPLGPEDRVAQASNVSFDAAVFEVWGALAHGAALVGIDRDVLLSAPALARALRALRVTHLYQTAALFSQHVREQVDVYAGLKQLVFGAEAVGTESVRRMLRGGRPERVLHEYGPTEATVWCTLHPVDRVAEGAATVSIGRPVPNARAYVLDAGLQPVPPAVPGELYVGGAGVVRGYRRRPSLTAERFVPDPFAAGPGARMYRTGDRARWRPDGRLEFMGRFDDQVKVRGFRIEPAEVEAALAAHPGVRQARVAVREDAPGDKRLVAYVAGDADGEALRAHLRRRLPEYMVPHAFVMMERLPLTPNGKLDRGALPAPGEWAPAGAAFVAPRTPAEETLAAIWADVLRVERVGVHDGFFELGGHSLLATRVVSRIRAAFGVELPLRALFEGPTVHEAASRVEALRRAELPQLPPVVPVRRDAPPPLTFAQERLWFLDRLQPGSFFYNVPGALRLEGRLDAPALERAFGDVVRRHEALRTTFAEVDGEPVQVIAPFRGFALPVEDLSGLEEAEREARARRRAAAEAERPFDLAVGPLFRARLLRLGGEDHVLLLSMHHIVSDGWSMDVLFRELSALYAAHAGGGGAPLPDLPVQYADYAAWQREQLRGEALERGLAWWKERLAGAPELLALPTDHPRPAVQGFRGATEPIHLPPGVLARLEALGRGQGATLFMVLLGAFQVLLSRYAGGEDVVVGTTIAGRTRAEAEPLIGLFMNALVLRTDLSGDPDFLEVLRRVREVTLGAYEHQEVPFEKLVAELRPERALSHSPLFQVLFELRPAEDVRPHLAGLAVRAVHAEVAAAKVDLAVWLRATPGGLAGGLTYRTDLFEPATARRMVEHLGRVLERVAAAPDARLSEVELMDAAGRRQVLEEWNRTSAPYAADLCIHQLFEAQARRTPDAPAVVFAGESLSFAEVDARSNRLARHLVRLGVGPEVRVGICMERAPELVVAVLGVMKAGGAWVPADPAHPAERIAHVMRDGGVRVLLTQARLGERVPADEGTPVVFVDDGWASIAAESAEPVESGVGSENLAYVIYTSGSTGQPKGVAMHHRGVVNYLQWGIGHYGADRGGGSPVFTSLAVDLTITNLLPLFAGRPVHLLPEESPVEALAEAIRGRSGFGVIKITPVHLGLLNAMLDPAELAAAAHTLVIGADFLSAEPTVRWQEHAPGVRLMNEYGPTETVVGCSAYTLPPGMHRAGAVPVGGPIRNLRFYVLDARMRPVPVGLPGELYIGGAGVARGYLGRPGLTAETFVPEPFAGGGARMYRSGDRARWLDGGSLEVLGRTDAQVKVRGYRVEPGEVDAALRRHPGVAACVVVAREDRPGDRRLVAYVVGAAEPAELREHLRRTLPEYMLPAAFVRLDALPRTPTGKLDPRALPAPEYAPAAGYVAPRTAVEETLAEIWAEVLGAPRVGVADDFFALGGHSLLAMRLIASVRATFGVEVPIRAVFSAPTLEGMAGEVERLAFEKIAAMPEDQAERLAALTSVAGG